MMTSRPQQVRAESWEQHSRLSRDARHRGKLTEISGIFPKILAKADRVLGVDFFRKKYGPRTHECQCFFFLFPPSTQSKAVLNASRAVLV